MSRLRGGSRYIKNLQRNKTGDFYSCVKWPLTTYRYICLFPVSLKSGNEDSFSFRWTSPYTIFINIPILILHAVLLGFYFWDFLRSKWGFPITSLTLNYLCGFMTSVFMLKFARDFPLLFKKVLAIEKKLPPIKRNNLVVQHIPAFIIVGCLLSFIYCILNFIYLYHMARNCSPLGEKDLLKTYLDHTFHVVFQYIEYNHIAGVIFQVLKCQNLIMLTLNDIFVIACCVYLENRFDNLNDIIRDEQKRYNGVVYMDWRKIQDHYVELTKLVKVIDKRVNPIVFIVFFIDLYNSCYHFYYVIMKKNYSSFSGFTDCVELYSNDLETKYFKPFLAFFMLFKTVTVSLICARLYTSSREPLKGLHSIVQAVYNYDTHRFMEQVYHSNVALSGFEFFYITKAMILTVLSILVTYELVLIQFK